MRRVSALNKMMSKDDLRRIGLEALEDIGRFDDAAAYSLRMTSGTMGQEPVLFARRRVMPEEKPIDFYPDMKAIILFAGTFSMRLRFLADLLVDYEPEGRRILIVDSKDLNNNFERILDDFVPDCFFGFPSFVAEALSRIRDSALLSRLRLISCSGEFLTKELESFFCTKVPQATVSDWYGVSDAGGIISDSPCRYLSRSIYHPAPGIEIGVENSDENGEGDIVATYNLGPSVRVDRYNTGDRGKMILEECLCGREDTFVVLGRKNADALKFLGTTLRREEFDRVAKELERYIVDYRAVAREHIKDELLQGEIVLEIISTPYLQNQPEPEELIKKLFAERLFVTPSRTLSSFINGAGGISLKIIFKESFSPETKVLKLKKIYG